MTPPKTILADEREAARLMSLKRVEFTELVDRGLLPRACEIGGHKRWRVADLERVASGQAMDEFADPLPVPCNSKSRWEKYREFPRQKAEDIQDINGTARLREAIAVLENFPAPDLVFPLLYGDASSLCAYTVPERCCVYVMTGVIGAQILTLYVGETTQPADRIPKHLGDYGNPGTLRPYFQRLEVIADRPLKHTQVRFWYAEQERKCVERVLSNVLGAAFECRERKVRGCLPTAWKAVERATR